MHELFRLEQFSRDSFRVKRTYIDICGDLVAGILLGQIVYWFMPNEHGESKLRVWKDGELWLAKGRNDWWGEIRITAKQFDRAIKILEDKGFVETKKFKFNGAPTIHIKLNVEEVTEAVNSILTVGEDGFLPKGKIQFTERGKSLTEITTKITTNIDDDDKDEPTNEISREEETKCNPIAEFEKAFGYLPPPILQQEFGQVIESGQFQEPEAIIVEAIRLARKQMPRNPARYISSILRNFEFMGLFTLEDVKEYNEVFEKKRKQTPRRRQSPTEINWDEL